MWDLPEPGTETVSSALQGGFFTTEPSSKLCGVVLLHLGISIFKPCGMWAPTHFQ